LEAGSPHDVLAGRDVVAGEYWTDHFVLGKPAKPIPKRLGPDMRRGLLINAFIPMLYAYGCLRNEPSYSQKALHWLRELRPERNVLLGGWERLGFTPAHAADGQALLELKQEYCNKRRCLDCAIGCALLKQE
jgi:Protein of unknown function (DUF2851)